MMGPVGETRGRSRGARPGRGCGDPGTKRRPELGALGSHPGGGIRSQGQRRGGGGGPCACDCPPEGREAGAALLPAAVGRESLLSSRNPSRRRDTQAVTSAAVDLSPRGNLGTPFGSNSGGFVKWVLVQPEGWAVLQPSTSDLRGVWGSPLPCSPPALLALADLGEVAGPPQAGRAGGFPLCACRVLSRPCFGSAHSRAPAGALNE